MMVTYADVADTLPVDVREAIERELPCRVSVTAEHLWDHDTSIVVDWTCDTVRIDAIWRCVHCGQTSHNDPRPAWAIELDKGIVIWRSPWH